jgi:hypothetical protein
MDSAPAPSVLKRSLRERRAFVESRRLTFRCRDERRRVLAESDTPVLISRERGFLVVPEGTLPYVRDVVRDARELIERYGASLPASKKHHLTTNLLAPDSLTLASSYMRLALSSEVLGAVAAYLGVVPLLHTVDVWHSRPTSGQLRSSQLFHLDSADVTQLKLFVHCTEVGADSGPLTVLDATRSQQIIDTLDPRFGGGRLADDQVAAILGGDSAGIALTGPPGTATFVDTSRCFHFGSRLPLNAPPRTMVLIQYLTPYAPIYESDSVRDAPYRHLSAATLSERQRLVLGVD